MKPTKERAAPGQREKKIANLQTILAEIHRIQPRDRTVAAPNAGSPNQSTRRIPGQLAQSPICFHPSCNLPQLVRSKATSRMIEIRNNRCSSSASRRSPSNTTTLPAARAPAGKSLRLFSTDPLRTTLQRHALNLQAYPCQLLQRGAFSFRRGESPAYLAE